MTNFYKQKDLKNIKPQNNEYKCIDNPEELFICLTKIWSKDTCAPRMANEWTKDNITLGQCSITAFLVQDIFGGLVYGIDLKDGNYHCYNRVDGICFDLTSDQFKEQLEYNKQNLQIREIHFQKKEKYNRYLFLRDKLNEYLKTIDF